MSPEAIGDLTVAVLFLAIVFFVIGVLVSVNWIWRKACPCSERRIDRRLF